MLRAVITLAFFLFATAAQAQSFAPSVWKNQRGSEMQVHWWNPVTNEFGGVYINRAPGYPRCANTPYTMTGKSNGNRVTFTVVWTNIFDDCKSKTVWRGRVRGNQMATKWLLTWAGGQKVGRDLFTRQ